MRLGARGTQRLTSQWRLTLEPERLKNRLTTARKDSRGWNGLQRHSSCLWFQILGVERTPFFQTIKIIAAILRASVRRAISGRIPLATSAA